MVKNVSDHFQSTHQNVKIQILISPFQEADVLIIDDFLQATQLLKSYIYYTGVFLIDAKETTRLYSIGLELIKNHFIAPNIYKILLQIWSLTRELPLESSMEQIAAKLSRAKELLQIIQACGWQNSTIIRTREGQLQFTTTKEEPNCFFQEQIEKPYNKLVKDFISKIPHTPPLSILRNQLSSERNIVYYLTPTSQDRIMESIETDSLKKVVNEVGEEIGEMVKAGRDDEVEAVVVLFETIDQKQESKNKFHLGQQFITSCSSSENKPFKILAKMFYKFLLQNEPGTLENLLEYMARFDAYLKRVFRNQNDVRVGYLEALEVIVNKRKDLCAQILKIENKQHPYLPLLASLLYGNNFIQDYFEMAKHQKDAFFIKNYKQNCEEGTLRWWKSVECERYIQQLQKPTIVQDKLSLTIISQIHFNEFKDSLITQKKLPISLQQLLPKEEKKTLQIIQEMGYGVVEYKSHNLILSNSQLICLLLIEEQGGRVSTKFLQENLLEDALQQLVNAQILNKANDGIKNIEINNVWKGNKKTVSFIK